LGTGMRSWNYLCLGLRHLWRKGLAIACLLFILALAMNRLLWLLWLLLMGSMRVVMTLMWVHTWLRHRHLVSMLWMRDVLRLRHSHGD